MRRARSAWARQRHPPALQPLLPLLVPSEFALRNRRRRVRQQPPRSRAPRFALVLLDECDSGDARRLGGAHKRGVRPPTRDHHRRLIRAALLCEERRSLLAALLLHPVHFISYNLSPVAAILVGLDDGDVVAASVGVLVVEHHRLLSRGRIEAAAIGAAEPDGVGVGIVLTLDRAERVGLLDDLSEVERAGLDALVGGARLRARVDHRNKTPVELVRTDDESERRERRAIIL